MAGYKVCVVGGWCGNRMVIVAEHLSELLARHGYPCRIVHHSVWENPAAPLRCNLVLQLLPAFSQAETGCPVLGIKPLLLDLDHPPTIEKILKQVAEDYPQAARPEHCSTRAVPAPLETA